MKLHPQFIKKENRRFVVIPVEEYQFLEERMRDYEHLRNLDEAAAEAKAKDDLER
ncbi:MAG: type II toxin-antitoxin system Phd/YefM family antitoxin [Gammaproteobacteria bacterium]